MLPLNEGVYQGLVSNGKPHGNGLLVYHRNNKYGRKTFEGEWRDGMMHGKGVLTYANGEVFDREWRDDKMV